jgi:hypothetical protein
MSVELSAPETGRVRVCSILLHHAAAVRSVIRLIRAGIPPAAILMVFANEQETIGTTTAEHASLTWFPFTKEGELMGEGATPVAPTIPGAFLLGSLVGVEREAHEGAVENLVAMGLPANVAYQYARVIEDGGVAIIVHIPQHREWDVRQVLETHEPMKTIP